MNVSRISDKDRCPACGLSKNPDTADLVHVRLGLDEPPEPLLCKCKPVHETVYNVLNKTREALACVNLNVRQTMDTVLKADINTARVVSVSKSPVIEVEARLNMVMSKILYVAMNSSVFGQCERYEIVETGCSWWTGQKTNMIAKLRSRNHEEMVAKMVVSTCQFMPGITLAISYEYPFNGEIMRPEYTTKMDEIRVSCNIADMNVTIIARRYKCEDTESFAAEVEFPNGVTHMFIRRVMKIIINTTGSMYALRKFVNPVFMSEVRYTDHDVVDVTDLDAHRGTIMQKADGMKVYVFCYASGYVITQTDDNLTVISYVVAIIDGPIYECTDMPDVLVAEMMVDGTLIYIDTLCKDGFVFPKVRKHPSRPLTNNVKPAMIIRKAWNSIMTMPKNVSSSMESDGVVCVTNSRTLRLKEPTIDLLYKNKNMYATEVGKLVAITKGHKSMMENSVYEMSVNKQKGSNSITLSHPVRRLVKKRPNNTDIIRRAFMSVLTDTKISTILYDVTTMSFKMRKRVYEMAQSNASMSRKVIITFGAGRFQEINEMKLDEYSYIAIDPVIDTTRLNKWKRPLRILPYDVNSSLSKQIIGITRKPGTVLYYQGRSEEFMRQADVHTTMSSFGIPAVFSFSISYHIMIINSLMTSNVSVYGCGFVHDKMPIKGVGVEPVTMNLVREPDRPAFVRTQFGKSTYDEPILRMNSIRNMHTVKSVFPELWSDVDASTIEIMSRGVLMY
ncbi:hypothetical protein MY10362_009158 [Beauveria mimosiformis]